MKTHSNYFETFDCVVTDFMPFRGKNTLSVTVIYGFVFSIQRYNGYLLHIKLLFNYVVDLMKLVSET